MALPGSLFLTGLWAWLAITTGASVWWFIAGGGAAMSVVLAVAIAAFGLALSIRDDPAVERSTPDSPAELVGVDPSAQGPAPNLR
jgi:hypothetical protein